jgi:hypothetical protein
MSIKELYSLNKHESTANAVDSNNAFMDAYEQQLTTCELVLSGEFGCQHSSSSIYLNLSSMANIIDDDVKAKAWLGDGEYNLDLKRLIVNNEGHINDALFQKYASNSFMRNYIEHNLPCLLEHFKLDVITDHAVGTIFEYLYLIDNNFKNMIQKVFSMNKPLPKEKTPEVLCWQDLFDSIKYPINCQYKNNNELTKRQIYQLIQSGSTLKVGSQFSFIKIETSYHLTIGNKDIQTCLNEIAFHDKVGADVLTEENNLNWVPESLSFGSNANDTCWLPMFINYLKNAKPEQYAAVKTYFKNDLSFENIMSTFGLKSGGNSFAITAFDSVYLLDSNFCNVTPVQGKMMHFDEHRIVTKTQFANHLIMPFEISQYMMNLFNNTDGIDPVITHEPKYRYGGGRNKDVIKSLKVNALTAEPVAKLLWFLLDNVSVVPKRYTSAKKYTNKPYLTQNNIGTFLDKKFLNHTPCPLHEFIPDMPNGHVICDLLCFIPIKTNQQGKLYVSIINNYHDLLCASHGLPPAKLLTLKLLKTIDKDYESINIIKNYYESSINRIKQFGVTNEVEIHVDKQNNILKNVEDISANEILLYGGNFKNDEFLSKFNFFKDVSLAIDEAESSAIYKEAVVNHDMRVINNTYARMKFNAIYTVRPNNKFLIDATHDNENILLIMNKQSINDSNFTFLYDVCFMYCMHNVDATSVHLSEMALSSLSKQPEFQWQEPTNAKYLITTEPSIHIIKNYDLIFCVLPVLKSNNESTLSYDIGDYKIDHGICLFSSRNSSLINTLNWTSEIAQGENSVELDIGVVSVVYRHTFGAFQVVVLTALPVNNTIVKLSVEKSFKIPLIKPHVLTAAGLPWLETVEVNVNKELLNRLIAKNLNDKCSHDMLLEYGMALSWFSYNKRGRAIVKNEISHEDVVSHVYIAKVLTKRLTIWSQLSNYIFTKGWTQISLAALAAVFETCYEKISLVRSGLEILQHIEVLFNEPMIRGSFGEIMNNWTDIDIWLMNKEIEVHQSTQTAVCKHHIVCYRQTTDTSCQCCNSTTAESNGLCHCCNNVEEKCSHDCIVRHAGDYTCKCCNLNNETNECPCCILHFKEKHGSLGQMHKDDVKYGAVFLNKNNIKVRAAIQDAKPLDGYRHEHKCYCGKTYVHDHAYPSLMHHLFVGDCPHCEGNTNNVSKVSIRSNLNTVITEKIKQFDLELNDSDVIDAVGKNTLTALNIDSNVIVGYSFDDRYSGIPFCNSNTSREKKKNFEVVDYTDVSINDCGVDCIKYYIADANESAIFKITGKKNNLTDMNIAKVFSNYGVNSIILSNDFATIQVVDNSEEYACIIHNSVLNDNNLNHWVVGHLNRVDYTGNYKLSHKFCNLQEHNKESFKLFKVNYNFTNNNQKKRVAYELHVNNIITLKTNHHLWTYKNCVLANSTEIDEDNNQVQLNVPEEYATLFNAAFKIAGNEDVLDEPWNINEDNLLDLNYHRYHEVAELLKTYTLIMNHPTKYSRETVFKVYTVDKQSVIDLNQNYVYLKNGDVIFTYENNKHTPQCVTVNHGKIKIALTKQTNSVLIHVPLHSVASIIMRLKAIFSSNITSERLIELLKKAKYVLGPGGSGKTTMIEKFLSEEKPKNITLVAGTSGGKSSLNDKIATLSYMAVSTEKAMVNAEKKQILIIDEATLLRPHEVMYLVSNNTERIEFYGDLMQIGIIDMYNSAGTRHKINVMQYAITNNLAITHLDVSFRYGNALVKELNKVQGLEKLQSAAPNDITINLGWAQNWDYSNIEPHTIGVNVILCFYGAHVDAIRKKLAAAGRIINITTVHKFQGQEKDRVLVIQAPFSNANTHLDTNQCVSACTRAKVVLNWLSIDCFTINDPLHKRIGGLVGCQTAITSIYNSINLSNDDHESISFILEELGSLNLQHLNMLVFNSILNSRNDQMMCKISRNNGIITLHLQIWYVKFKIVINDQDINIDEIPKLYKTEILYALTKSITESCEYTINNIKDGDVYYKELVHTSLNVIIPLPKKLNNLIRTINHIGKIFNLNNIHQSPFSGSLSNVLVVSSSRSCAACGALTFIWPDNTKARITKDYFKLGGRSIIGERANDLIESLLYDTNNILPSEFLNERCGKLVLYERISLFGAELLNQSWLFEKLMWSHKYDNKHISDKINLLFDVSIEYTGFDPLEYYPIFSQMNETTGKCSVARRINGQYEINETTFDKEHVLQHCLEVFDVYQHEFGSNSLIQSVVNSYTGMVGALDRYPGMAESLDWHTVNKTAVINNIANRNAKRKIASLAYAAKLIHVPTKIYKLAEKYYDANQLFTSTGQDVLDNGIYAVHDIYHVHLLLNTYNSINMQLTTNSPLTTYVLEAFNLATSTLINSDALIIYKLNLLSLNNSMIKHLSNISANDEKYTELAKFKLNINNLEWTNPKASIYVTGPIILENNFEDWISLLERYEIVHFWTSLNYLEKNNNLFIYLADDDKAYKCSKFTLEMMKTTGFFSNGINTYKFDVLANHQEILHYQVTKAKHNLNVNVFSNHDEFMMVGVPTILLSPASIIKHKSILQLKMMKINVKAYNNLSRRALRDDTKYNDLLIQARTLINTQQFTTSAVVNVNKISSDDAICLANIVWIERFWRVNSYKLINKEITIASLIISSLTTHLAEFIKFLQIDELLIDLKNYLSEKSNEIITIFSSFLENMEKIRLQTKNNKRVFSSKNYQDNIQNKLVRRLLDTQRFEAESYDLDSYIKAKFNGLSSSRQIDGEFVWWANMIYKLQKTLFKFGEKLTITSPLISDEIVFDVDEILDEKNNRIMNVNCLWCCKLAELYKLQTSVNFNCKSNLCKHEGKLTYITDELQLMSGGFVVLPNDWLHLYDEAISYDEDMTVDNNYIDEQEMTINAIHTLKFDNCNVKLKNNNLHLISWLTRSTNCKIFIDDFTFNMYKNKHHLIDKILTGNNTFLYIVDEFSLCWIKTIIPLNTQLFDVENGQKILQSLVHSAKNERNDSLNNDNEELNVDDRQEQANYDLQGKNFNDSTSQHVSSSMMIDRLIDSLNEADKLNLNTKIASHPDKLEIVDVIGYNPFLGLISSKIKHSTILSDEIHGFDKRLLSKLNVINYEVSEFYIERMVEKFLSLNIDKNEIINVYALTIGSNERSPAETLGKHINIGENSSLLSQIGFINVGTISFSREGAIFRLFFALKLNVLGYKVRIHGAKPSNYSLWTDRCFNDIILNNKHKNLIISPFGVYSTYLDGLYLGNKNINIKEVTSIFKSASNGICYYGCDEVFVKELKIDLTFTYKDKLVIYSNLVDLSTGTIRLKPYKNKLGDLVRMDNMYGITKADVINSIVDNSTLYLGNDTNASAHRVRNNKFIYGLNFLERGFSELTNNSLKLIPCKVYDVNNIRDVELIYSPKSDANCVMQCLLFSAKITQQNTNDVLNLASKFKIPKFVHEEDIAMYFNALEINVVILGLIHKKAYIVSNSAIVILQLIAQPSGVAHCTVVNANFTSNPKITSFKELSISRIMINSTSRIELADLKEINNLINYNKYLANEWFDKAKHSNMINRLKGRIDLVLGRANKSIINIEKNNLTKYDIRFNDDIIAGKVYAYRSPYGYNLTLGVSINKRNALMLDYDLSNATYATTFCIDIGVRLIDNDFNYVNKVVIDPDTRYGFLQPSDQFYDNQHDNKFSGVLVDPTATTLIVASNDNRNHHHLKSHDLLMSKLPHNLIILGNYQWDAIEMAALKHQGFMHLAISENGPCININCNPKHEFKLHDWLIANNNLTYHEISIKWNGVGIPYKNSFNVMNANELVNSLCKSGDLIQDVLRDSNHVKGHDLILNTKRNLNYDLLNLTDDVIYELTIVNEFTNNNVYVHLDSNFILWVPNALIGINISVTGKGRENMEHSYIYVEDNDQSFIKQKWYGGANKMVDINNKFIIAEEVEKPPLDDKTVSLVNSLTCINDFVFKDNESWFVEPVTREAANMNCTFYVGKDLDESNLNNDIFVNIHNPIVMNYWDDDEAMLDGTIELPHSEINLKYTADFTGIKFDKKTMLTLYPTNSQPAHTKRYMAPIQAVSDLFGKKLTLRKHIVDPKIDARLVAETYFVKNFSDSLEPIYLNVQDVCDWLKERPDCVKISEDLEILLSEGLDIHGLDRVNVHAKLESRMKDTLLYSYSNNMPNITDEQRLRLIVWQRKGITTIFSSAFKQVKQNYKKSCLPKYVYTDGMTPMQISNLFNTIVSDNVYFIEDDLKKQDRQTDHILLDTEMELYKLLGMNSNLVDIWRLVHNDWKAHGAGLKFTGDASRHTGQATTAIGNELVNIIVKRSNC